MLSEEEVKKVARLARLTLSDAEVASYREQLSGILDYVSELGKVATGDGELVRHVPKDAVSFREDVAVPFQDYGSILENASSTEDGAFLLPNVFE